jgi:hypothetical protein
MDGWAAAAAVVVALERQRKNIEWSGKRSIVSQQGASVSENQSFLAQREKV